MADEVCGLIPGLLEEGLTEVEFAGRVEAEARRLGHEGYIRMRGFNQEMFYGQLLTGVSGTVPSYLDTPLAGTGLSASVAQGASFRRIGRGEPVVFDFVPVRDGYMADFTRAYQPRAAARGAHARLRRRPARAGGGDGGRPARRSCRAVWEAARAPPRRRGWPANFMGHGAGQVPYVGHGIGIELDELPVLTGSSLELEPGMVFALEPKFVLPGLGAIGIENTWVVTDDGAERLTLAPEELVIVRTDRIAARRARVGLPRDLRRKEVTMQQLAPSVWAHVLEAEGFQTAAAVVLTPRRAFVVDTLTGPEHMRPVLEFLAAEAGGRPGPSSTRTTTGTTCSATPPSPAWTSWRSKPARG